MGSELYLRARQCRFGWAGALLFAAGGTVIWEYAAEANGVRPSAQDLVYTPLAGLVLGELRYAAWRGAGAVAHAETAATLRVLVDPFGELGRGLGAPC
jgi:hypothetical protein